MAMWGEEDRKDAKSRKFTKKRKMMG